MTVPTNEPAPRNPISVGGLAQEHAAAVVVIGALVFLILVSRGWRGASVGGVGISVK